MITITDGSDYTFGSNNSTICFADGTNIGNLNITGTNDTLRFCGNSTIGSISGSYGEKLSIVNTSAGYLNLINSSLPGVTISVFNYGGLTAGPLYNGNNLTTFNIGTMAVITVNGPATSNGDTLYILGGTFNTQSLTLNANSYVCLSHNAVINTTDFTINGGAFPLVSDPSYASCLHYTGIATLNINPVTNSALSICAGSGSSFANGATSSNWGPNVIYSNPCTDCNTSGLLPVKLKNFTASINNKNNVLLQWISAEEINTARYEVQRSTNGGAYTTISSVAALGNSSIAVSYIYTDVQPEEGVNLYRLKMIDQNNSYAYSSTVKILFSPNTKNFYAVANYSGITAYLPVINGKGFIRLIDLQGRVLFQQQVYANQTQVSIPANNIASGSYFVQYSDEQMKQSQQVFIQK
jgi:hypothetical protein